MDGNVQYTFVDGTGRTAQATWHAAVQWADSDVAYPDRYAHYGDASCLSRATITWKSQGYTPSPAPGCPSTVTVGPVTVNATPEDGLTMGQFPDDVAPLTYGTYGVHTVAAGGGAFGPCWENEGEATTSVPWWETGPAGSHHADTTGGRLIGRYTTPFSGTNPRPFTAVATWTWALAATPPHLPSGLIAPTAATRSPVRVATTCQGQPAWVTPSCAALMPRTGPPAPR